MCGLLYKTKKMSKQNKKCAKNRTQRAFQHNNLSDITLNYYANSPDGKGRPRKTITSNILREVKQLSIQEDNRAWDEKLEDFECDFHIAEDEEDRKVHLVKKERRHKKSENKSDKSKSGSEYPLDIWFLLSEYMRPEDVSTFSRICKTALYVVNTPKFWLSLYRRYYKLVANMPERLRPQCIVRHYGLKANVVRSLYYMYPPYVQKMSVKTPLDATYKLIRRQCICLWHEKCIKTNKNCYNFKLMRKDVTLKQISNEVKVDMLEMLDDIFANTEAGCKILQVISSVYIPLPVVMGSTLQSVALNIDPISVCLQLIFGSGLFCNGKFQNAGATTVVLKSVVKVCVLDWWHPDYPHSTNIVYSNTEED